MIDAEMVDGSGGGGRHASVEQHLQYPRAELGEVGQVVNQYRDVARCDRAGQGISSLLDMTI